ncbi:histidine kinase dimerization/phosphoacceptor domain -containing protein [Emticicia sp. C21]|uniref:histidine kinase dimerization/phosphoacceptor domain -containing protein n=1 Tax=Emticicia sp. C21 TaxID=2302915 RepID=UPI000E35438A|nr:histidine kinase dimerization/phosphoacceptor domain -containing protein [Emticicia sp. C21]RFS15052.1 hypothetical protein D0T08_18415 [Emticicia sp. C21]
MKKTVFQFSLFIVVIIQTSFSQNPLPDDRDAYAKSVLKEGLANNDSVKIAEGYYLLAKRNDNNYPEATRLFNLSLNINKKLKDYYKVGRIYLRLSEFELQQGYFEKGKAFLDTAMAIFKKYKLAEGIKSARVTYSYYYNAVGDIESPRMLGTKREDSLSIADASSLHANREASKLNFAEAYRLFYLSLKIYQRYHEHLKTGRIYLSLSYLEAEQNNFEKSKAFLNEAISIFKKYNLPTGMASAYGTASEMYRIRVFTENPSTKASFDSALYYSRILEKKAIADKDEKALANVYLIMGNLYNFKKDKRAISYIESALKIKKKERPDGPLIHYQTNLASAYLISGNKPKAKEVLAESQKIIESKKYPIDTGAIANHDNIYAQYYVAVGDWKNAYDKRESGIRYQQRFAAIDRQGNVSRWEVQMETDKKDLEIKLQKSENENKQKLISQQRYIIGLVTLFFTILTLLSYFLYKNYKKQKLLSQRNAVLIQEQNHRVKNNLQVISSLLNLQAKYLEDTQSKTVFNESQTRLESIVLLHRQLYENDNVESINIEELLQDIANSVALTFGFDHIETNLLMEIKWIKTDVAIAIGLIMNELIINSFKYAFADKEPRIEILSKQNNQQIEITYKDFGSKNLEQTIKGQTNKSFGLKLINMLLFQINGTSTYNYLNGSAFTISFSNT